jgi:gamma-glutamyltranspeptidase / glutathione hydrolase
MLDPSRIATPRAPRAMVSTPDHLASEAGVAALRGGGNAVDAAVAASAVLAVTAPHLCGVGGDLWALVHIPGSPPVALDASGRAGSGADASRLRAEGHRVMPFTGDVRSVPVPGCVDGWVALSQRFGALDLADVLAPAMALATDGFPPSPLLALLVTDAWRRIPGAEDLEVVGGSEVVDPTAARLAPDVLVRRPRFADTLSAIASGGRDAFYAGPFGAGLLALGAGEFAEEDLTEPPARWVEPLGLAVWDHVLWTAPPGSQGYLTLASAWLAEHAGLPDDPGDPRWAHLLVEASRAAGHDRPAVLHEGADGAALLVADTLTRRLEAIDPERRAPWSDPATHDGDTIHLVAVDGDRMGVSLIQSNASGFGAELVVPGTGVFLHNRGIGFSLEPGHPAEYGPRRRPPSTLSPALVTCPDGGLRAAVGTMGGDSQPQILLQVLCRLLRHGQAPGRAVGSPRWTLANPGASGFHTWGAGDGVAVRVEADAPGSWGPGLEQRGHDVRPAGVLDVGSGFAQLISVDVGPGGVDSLAGGSDPRALIGAASGF